MPELPPAASFRLSEETHAYLWWQARQDEHSRRAVIAMLAKAEVIRRGGVTEQIVTLYRQYKANKQG